jgi:sporulation protein YlmC with PRC-barrel domain
MLQLSQLLLNRPILSLRAGTTVGHTLGPIINPNNLKIEGFYCQDKFDKKAEKVLLYQDIRDVLPQGMIVNDHDALTDPGELIRLKKTMDLKFNLLGKQVITVSKQKVGKVVDYATEIETLYIQKLYVSQPIYKNLNGGSLSVDRSQITEITSSQIIISDLMQTSSATVPATI